MEFSELYGVDMKTCLGFFTENLVEELGDVEMSSEETKYVASVLASFASTSRFEQGNWTPLAGTGEIFDRFVLRRDDTGFTIPQLTAQQAEIAGAQLMLIVGFFRSQIPPESEPEISQQTWPSLLLLCGQSLRRKKRRAS